MERSETIRDKAKQKKKKKLRLREAAKRCMRTWKRKKERKKERTTRQCRRNQNDEKQKGEDGTKGKMHEIVDENFDWANRQNAWCEPDKEKKESRHSQEESIRNERKASHGGTRWRKREREEPGREEASQARKWNDMACAYKGQGGDERNRGR